VIACLTHVQHDLFDLGGELCIPRVAASSAMEHVVRLERNSTLQRKAPGTQGFHPAGGGPAGAACHLARTITRRAERRLLFAGARRSRGAEVIRYLNGCRICCSSWREILARRQPQGRGCVETLGRIGSQSTPARPQVRKELMTWQPSYPAKKRARRGSLARPAASRSADTEARLRSADLNACY